MHTWYKGHPCSYSNKPHTGHRAELGTFADMKFLCGKLKSEWHAELGTNWNETVVYERVA
eukprot:5019742-Amphidinium_carterae.1